MAPHRSSDHDAARVLLASGAILLSAQEPRDAKQHHEDDETDQRENPCVLRHTASVAVTGRPFNCLVPSNARSGELRLVDDQRPCHTGVRFPRNASMPSDASSSSMLHAIASLVTAYALAIGCSTCA